MGIIILIVIIIMLILFYGNKLSSSALASDRIFVKYEDSIHDNYDQQIRMQRALDENLTFKKMAENKYGGTIIGSSGKSYSVSLRNCTCPDYQKRKLPCKHMYKFVLESGRANILQKENRLVIQKTNSEIHSTGTDNETHATLESIAFNDNMNYMLFEGEGVFEKTNRKRKIHIETFSEKEAIDELIVSGYIKNTISIHRIPFDSPSEEQLSAMRKHHNKIPKKACLNDMSFLISKYMNNEREPDKDLMNFATGQKVKFSYYTGEESLYNCIWNKFSLEEKFAFYVICVKKDITGIWDFNSFDRYKDMASGYLNDNTFINSFKRYSNKGGNFHGFIREKVDKDGFSINTTSRNTNCYKIAASIV